MLEEKNSSVKKVHDPYKITLPEFDINKFYKKGKIGSNPMRILEAIGLKEGEIVADFGCGVGFFVNESASIVGKKGKVFAIDISPDMLEMVKSKAIALGLRNVYGILADLEKPKSTKLGDSSVDLVMMINLLYLIKDKKAVIKEAYRILRPGGKLAIMDWSEKGIHSMIETEEMVHKEVKEIARTIGFKKGISFEAGISHEVNVFVK